MFLLCVYAWGSSKVACDLSVIWLLKRCQEICLAPVDQGTNSFLMPYDQVEECFGWCMKHTHAHRYSDIHSEIFGKPADDGGQRADAQISTKSFGSDRCGPSVYWL